MVVLIITSSMDATSSYIIKKYGRKVKFFRLDVDRFAEYSINIYRGKWEICRDNYHVSINDVNSIYYRKPMFPCLDSYDTAYRNMIQRDILAVINGIADSFSGTVLTKPHILRMCENKIYQLMCAEKCGFVMPISSITNDIRQYRKFCCVDSVIKPITTGKIMSADLKKIELYYTSRIRKVNEDIRLTPVYLQGYVNKEYEVRLIVVGGSFFATKILSQNKIDWRIDYNLLRYELIECPHYIKENCLNMMRLFNLKFGAFDFIVTVDNKWIFLEVNPNGQWLWLEKELGIRISEKIMDILVEDTSHGNYL